MDNLDQRLPAPDFRVQNGLTISLLFAAKTLEEMDRGERIRACYQHRCLRYVTQQATTNQSVRERFGLDKSQMETASRILRDTVEAGQIVIDPSKVNSMKYQEYVPVWA